MNIYMYVSDPLFEAMVGAAGCKGPLALLLDLFLPAFWGGLGLSFLAVREMRGQRA